MFPGKKLLFMGGEFGQRHEWNSGAALDWWVLQYPPHQGVQKYVKALNSLLRSQPALYEIDFEHGGFEWIDFGDYETGAISYLRRARNPSDFLVCVLNLTPAPRTAYRIGVPEAGFYRELLNSDSECFWGTNVGNGGGVQAEAMPWQGRPYSLSLTLPPLSIVVLKP
jgi:1,4-alpha-glucan branching enzyme